MGYFKCKDCVHFKKGFIYNFCKAREEVIFSFEGACMCFESNNPAYTCSKCKHYSDSGRCKNRGSVFLQPKYDATHPACDSFKPQDDCFLTSACVSFMGKPDNCEELTVLRAFRDTYMKQLKNGQNYIDEYYEIAPQIVEKINSSNTKNEWYEYIYTVVVNCVNLIRQNKNNEALNKYREMVLKLKKELL